MIKNDVNQDRVAAPVPSKNGQAGTARGLREPGTSPSQYSKRRRRLFTIISTLLLIMLILAAVRVTGVASGSNDQLVLKIAGQQQALVDLRQSVPISPYLFGVNVFPEDQSSSVDADYTGFMSYDPQIVNGLQNVGIKLLRFPGGSWGEDQPLQNHILSLQQLKDFSDLLYAVGADGMIQARLSSPITKDGGLATVAQRANLAGRWVDFMSNPHSDLRTGPFKNVQIHPIKFWSVGNEPNRLINPETGKYYTVSEYVNAFIQFSIQMHQNNPTIMVFGPELSQFDGVGVGPKDSQGAFWMEDFLKGVAAYEKATNFFNVHHYHLLDGVSFHSYQFADASTNPYMLMSSPNEWNYLLSQLHQLIRQAMGHDLPIAITEINTNPNSQVPTRGQAALWWADTLGELMNQQVEYVAFFSAEGVNDPYPLFTSDGSHQQTAMFRVMQIFSHLQHDLIPLQVQRDPVSVYATRDDASDTVSLLFINKSGQNQFAEVSAQNQVFGTSPWHTQDISIGANSMVVVTLHRGGGAVAYSFAVPNTQDATINTVKLTVCGSKTDLLAYNVPC